MKSYTATTKRGSRLITVLADNFTDAKVRIKDQLNRPGRRDVLNQWMRQGQNVKSEKLAEMFETEEAAITYAKIWANHYGPCQFADINNIPDPLAYDNDLLS